MTEAEIKDKMLSIFLNGNRIFKISHGLFKDKNTKSVLDIFKQNNWVVLHEVTKKHQCDGFKERLHEGDYLYIIIRGEEFFEIAKVKSGSWKYVPKYIIGESGWIYREVEYIKTPIKANLNDSDLNSFFRSSASWTLFEITPERLNEANENLFKPYFGVEFLEGELEKSDSKKAS